MGSDLNDSISTPPVREGGRPERGVPERTTQLPRARLEAGAPRRLPESWRLERRRGGQVNAGNAMHVPASRPGLSRPVTRPHQRNASRSPLRSMASSHSLSGAALLLLLQAGDVVHEPLDSGARLHGQDSGCAIVDLGCGGDELVSAAQQGPGVA